MAAGVVAGWPDRAERGVAPTRREGVRRGEHRAGAEQRRLPRARAGPGVRVEETPALHLAEVTELVEVVLGVHEGQLVEGGRARLDGDERVADLGVVGAVDDRAEPLGPLGMVRGGDVVQITRVRGEEEGHTSNATVMRVVRFARRFSVPDVVLRAGGAAIRVRPWPGDESTAQVLPVPGALLPSASEVGRWLHALSRLGYHRVRTAALGPQDQGPYLEAGLDPLEELALLRRPLARAAAGAGAPAAPGGEP